MLRGVETFLAGGGAVLLMVGWQLIRAFDRRQEERRAAIRRGEIVEPGPAGWRDPRPRNSPPAGWRGGLVRAWRWYRDL
jgi:hypothetical protein